ncbi:HigA family addiction module antitoxin [Caulobacter sp.]|uniref:HigA family addiction module antitoxin n=1 Tax=Caulobacter sp. TaxID=78 RepID=UPI002B467E45|nr:HigA family addiction module antitoxin [Caulobacter sp.]HJV41693.1 HigA family addiction module antitoxin [Caulobacter sp.]
MSRSATTIETRPAEWLPNPTPGDILLEDFLKPIGMSQTALAKAIGVPPRRINEIVLGKQAVTADTDLRLHATGAYRQASGSASRWITT